MNGDLGTLRTELTDALTDLSVHDTQKRPQDRQEKWNIQQIVEHLVKTYSSSVDAIQVRLDKRSPTRAVPTLQQRLGQLLVLDLRRFPAGREAPAAVAPVNDGAVRSGGELAELVRVELERLEATLVQGDAMFGRQRAVSHFALGPLSMQGWRRFHLVHGRHHLKHIAGIVGGAGA